jgi:predicted SprT family Zn-dependent metalloprotease
MPRSLVASDVTGNRAVRSARCGMTESFHRACKCGAIYSRTESMADGREIDSFQCDVCGATLESWNTAWVPHYRLVAGLVRSPEDSQMP